MSDILTLTGNVREDSITYGIRVVLFSSAVTMQQLRLPEKPDGVFSFSEDQLYRFVSFRAGNGGWVACCRRTAHFNHVPMEQLFEVPLQCGQLLELEEEGQLHYILAERDTEGQRRFYHYKPLMEGECVVGCHHDCEIRYDITGGPDRQAVLLWRNNCWSISDLGSPLGVYVNGERQERACLKLGDQVRLGPVRILVGLDSIAINNAGDGIVIGGHVLSLFGGEPAGYRNYSQQDVAEMDEENWFNRAPRKRFVNKRNPIVIEAPPLSVNQQKIPMLLRMGGPMIHGGAAALGGNYMLLLSSVLFPLLSSRYTEKQRQEYENLRVTKYREYLEGKKNEIEAACREEKEYLSKRYPEPKDIAQLLSERKRLWERRPMDSDFLHLRLGYGERMLSASIEYPPQRFELEPDILEEEMYRIAEQKYPLVGGPIVLSLKEIPFCGLSGERAALMKYLHRLVIQLAVFHSYDEVKLVFMMDEAELQLLDDIRYLPHVWDDYRTTRYIATNEEAAYYLGEQLSIRFSENKEEETFASKRPKAKVHYVIFALNKKLFEAHEIFKQIIQPSADQMVSVIFAYDELPKETQGIILLQPDGRHTFTVMSEDGGEDIQFQEDLWPSKMMDTAVRVLSNTRLRKKGQEREFPKTVSFLEMYRVGRVEQLNALERWSNSDATKSLAVPVGIGADGTVFMLDLHEKRQGPHGLVAGMTGSGKSEFIITYILSMAVNYHPDDVAFVLIDYKGGGLTDAFENERAGLRLPHLVGTITNLDGASIRRSLISIESELLRRQKVFRKTSQMLNEGTMNIYTYQKLYRAGKVVEPMPHLFIISDEFAELKQQQPEFMEKLISIARIGRSLGIHLILATQKPSGVVNDQIRSNTKFRICLKVQDRSDSMDMLKRPEAAELTDVGRFYLQVGYNEYFAEGQSGWCGAFYEPHDTVIVKKDDSVVFVDDAGRPLVTTKPKMTGKPSEIRQLGVIVGYLSDMAKAQGIAARKLWLPELPMVMDLDSLYDPVICRNSTSICLGKVDDPENQEQFHLVVDFAACKNMVIYGGAGSGKSTLLQNILYRLSVQLSPQELSYYVLDYSRRMLKIFTALPHCGEVLYEEDTTLLDEFFDVINGIIAERKRLFTALEVDNFSAAQSLRQIPLVLVVIDNITGLSLTKEGEAHLYKLQSYMKNCTDYGVCFIVTCSRYNDMSSRIRQEFGKQICLGMKDRYEYGDALNCKVSYVPAEHPGRGLVCFEGRSLEFQAATFCAGKSEKEQLKTLKKTIRMLCEKKGGGTNAQRLSVKDEAAEFTDFCRQFKPGRIPLGLARKNGKPIALPLQQFSVMGVYWGNSSGKVPVLRNILYAAQRENMELWIFKRIQQSVFDGCGPDVIVVDELKNADILSCSQENARLLQSAILAKMAEQKQVLQSYCRETEFTGDDEDAFIRAFHVLHEKTTPILLLIESVADLCSVLNVFSVIGFRDILRQMTIRNFYVVGCFEPDEDKNVAGNVLYTAFSQGDLLLFGGKFGAQKLCPVPQALDFTEELPYNVGLMRYRNRLHPILMPCGEVNKKEIDEDLRDIF